jgi:hypothetical protein
VSEGWTPMRHRGWLKRRARSSPSVTVAPRLTALPVVGDVHLPVGAGVVRPLLHGSRHPLLSGTAPRPCTQLPRSSASSVSSAAVGGWLFLPSSCRVYCPKALKVGELPKGRIDAASPR